MLGNKKGGVSYIYMFSERRDDFFDRLSPLMERLSTVIQVNKPVILSLIISV